MREEAITVAEKHELQIDATTENLQAVLDFVDEHLDRLNCSAKARMQIDIAVEEIFVNIASYAYSPETGKAILKVESDEETGMVRIALADCGIPYNPLEKGDPDVTLAAEDREIGGLGVYMVKKSMDEVLYEFKDGWNVLTLIKRC